MLNRAVINKIAKARLKDAEVLLAANRYDGAVYLCGYAVELGLKSKICKTLHWQEFPETNNEFKDYRSFKTHDLDVLLHLSGAEDKIKSQYFVDWSFVSQWNPEARYQPIGNVSKAEAKLMLSSAAVLLKIL